jgi:hypothetical protein
LDQATSKQEKAIKARKEAEQGRMVTAAELGAVISLGLAAMPEALKGLGAAGEEVLEAVDAMGEGKLALRRGERSPWSRARATAIHQRSDRAFSLPLPCEDWPRSKCR